MENGWIQRGELAATPSAVCPGTSAGWWLRWSRAQLHAWGWRRVLAHTGGEIDLAVDLGCGYGDWTARLASIARRVIAVDLSPGFVAQTRARLAGHADARVEHADVRHFVDYRDATVVHLGGVLTYVEDRDALEVLTLARHRLAPRGLLHTRDWCAINLGRPSRQHRAGIDSFHRTPAQYERLARRAGLRILEVRRSASIYGEQLAPHPALRWLPSFLWRLGTSYWTRGSVSFLFARA